MKFPDLEKFFEEQQQKPQTKPKPRKKPSYAPKEEGIGFGDMLKLIPKAIVIGYVIYTIIRFLT
jgi:hypothetical protein